MGHSLASTIFDDLMGFLSWMVSHVVMIVFLQMFERRPCREKHSSMLQLTDQGAVDEQQLATFLREVVPVMEQDFKFDQLPAI